MTKRRKKRHLLKNLLLIIVAIFFIIVGSSIIWLATIELPNLNSFNERKIVQSTQIYDRTGKILLYEIGDKAKRVVVPYDQISTYIKNATVAIEDEQFYKHQGVEISSLFRALIADIKSGSFSQGGSTITQQVVKNSLLTSEKKISRKVKEWILAYKLDKTYSKETILSYYLNDVPYGGSVYGIERASETFFGKNASQVTLGEAAYLASIPNAPTYFSPYGSHKKELDDRKNLVLQKMLSNGFISKKEYDEATKEKVEFKIIGDGSLKAPHFTLFIKEYLENKYGEALVSEGGLKVITSLDYDLQTKAEQIVYKYALQNEKNFNAENASLVAIDPKTGQILTMVGSRDYFDDKIDGNFNITTAHRQPGSSFKPFVYATALKKGFLPETRVFDLQTEFSTYCNPDGTPINTADIDKCYQPENYDGKFLGPISMRDALAQSRNVPAIKFLYLSGIKDSIQTAKDLGISSLKDANQYGLTLVLGGGEVSLLEMTSAYGVFANEGMRNNYTGILEVKDSSGKILEQFEPNPYQVLDKNIALTISDMLSDNNARAPEFGLDSALYVHNYDVAVKTGTTNDYRDTWIVGYSPNIVVGAWAGNNNNSPMEKKIAGFVVAPLWNEFIRFALVRLPIEYFNKPEIKDLSMVKPVIRGFWQGNNLYTIDTVSGKLATNNTPATTKEERVVFNIHDILHWVDKNNPLGAPPTNPELDPQYNLWEGPVQKWVLLNSLQNQTDSVIPKDFDNIHTQNNLFKLKILSPQDGLNYKKDLRMSVIITSSGPYTIKRYDVFLNGVYIGNVVTPNLVFSFKPGSERAIKNQNTLKIIGYDGVENSNEVVVHFNTE